MARNQEFSFSRWMVALLVGIPVAAGAFYLIRKKNKEHSLPDQNGTCKPDLKPSVKAGEKPEKREESHVEETPLDRALKLKTAGNGFYKKGDYKEAIRCYSEAISVCPAQEKEHMATLFQNRAAAYELLNETENVFKDCGSAIELKPDYVKALTRRYKAAEKLGKSRQALEDVTAVCLLEKFNNMDSLAAADRILKSIGQVEGERFMKTRSPVLPSEYFIKAYLASFTQDPVLKEIQSISSKEPSQLNGVERGLRALYDGNYENVVPALEEELAKPSSPLAKEQALLLRSSMRILTCQTSEAMEDLNHLIENSKQSKIKVNALLRRACLYMQAEDSERSFEDFNKASELDPTNPDVAHQKAQMLLLGERLEEAVREFHKAAQLNPSSGLIQVQKLFAEYRFGTTKEDTRLVAQARAGLEEAVSKFPNTPEGYMLLAQVYSDSKEFEKAEAIFDEGIKADSKNASILVHKGLLYLQWKGDMKKATELMEKAIAVDPKCEFAYETLASIEVQMGNLSRAVNLFDKAVPLAKSEREASHILSLRAAAQAQIVVAQTLGFDPILSAP